jgi:Putative transposase
VVIHLRSRSLSYIPIYERTRSFLDQRVNVDVVGFFGILHTWGQNLLFHPHIHCVIPGGGIAPDHSRWIHPRYPFFLPVKVLRKVFRGKFVAGLRRAFRKERLKLAGPIQHLSEPKEFAAFLRTLFWQHWVVHAKPAFGRPEQVVRYLGRYTHRIAISNHRLIAFDGDHVTFRWRDYARGNKQRLMTVSAEEFIRRFLVHVLPKGFVRIRHFGFMAKCPPVCIAGTVSTIVEHGAGDLFDRCCVRSFRPVLSQLSWTYVCCGTIYGGPVDVEICFGVFFRYVLACHPNSVCFVVLWHIYNEAIAAVS